MEVYKEKNQTVISNTLRRLLSHKLAVLGLVIIIFEILTVIFLPYIINLDPYTIDITSFGSPPSKEHLLGTDDVGRDLFSRLIYGGRVSLTVGIVSATISLIGIPLGILAGYFRGKVEMIIMRCADIFMSFPSMVLILVLASILGQSIFTVTVVIGILGWPEFARLIYSSVLSIREKDYVESGKAVGTKDFSIITKYILPNAFAPVIVAFTFRIAQAIIMESSLSFLGMGVQPPEASWGNILYYAQSISVLSSKPWVWLPPGIILIFTILSINFFGDGIRDALDTKMSI